jgi:hypothetical protein
MAAPDQSDTKLEHQPHAATTTRLSADVIVDKRDVHLGEWRSRGGRGQGFSRGDGKPTVQYPAIG